MTTNTKPKWIEGTPDAAGCDGWFWVVDEEGDYSITEVIDGKWKRPRFVGEVVAYSGPIEEPDEESLP